MFVWFCFFLSISDHLIFPDATSSKKKKVQERSTNQPTKKQQINQLTTKQAKQINDQQTNQSPSQAVLSRFLLFADVWDRQETSRLDWQIVVSGPCGNV